MSKMSDILDAISKHPLTDLLVVGFSDYDSVYQASRFHPMLQYVYLQFGEVFLRCISIHWYDLRMELTHEISHDYYAPRLTDDEEEREPYEDEEFCISSVYDLFVRKSESDHQVVEFRVFADATSKL